jgi:hypothetical protein
MMPGERFYRESVYQRPDQVELRLRIAARKDGVSRGLRAATGLGDS